MANAISRRLLLALFVLTGLVLVANDYVLTRYRAGRERAVAERIIKARAELLRNELEKLDKLSIGIWAATTAALCHARVIVLDSGGSVLADSKRESGPTADYTEFPQVQDALAGRAGSWIRSDLDDSSVLAEFASPVRIGGRSPAVLVLSAPLDESDGRFDRMRLVIHAIVIGAVLAALAVLWLATHTFERRVTSLKRYAESLLEGGSAVSAARSNGDLRALESTLACVASQTQNLAERLKVESARREAILSSMVEGVLAVDGNLRVTFCNEAVRRALGGTKTVSEGRSVLELVRDSRLYEVLSAVLQDGQPRRGRLSISAAKGRSFEVQAAPLATLTGRGALVILHDMTDLERLEQIRTDFVANVSHEMRTPLAGIIGCAETLLEGAINEAGHNRRFVEMIRSSAVRLNSIAADLLVLSELENGAGPSESGPVRVTDVLDTVISMLESEALQRDVQLIRENVEDVSVDGSRLRLEQVLLNLLANAIKFNREGGEVRIHVGSDPEGQIRIAISDTGVGIPSQDLPRIFERFYRVDKARSRQVGGTGLGLSIVRHIVERMNGSVTVHSQVGRGSTFTVLLPATQNEVGRLVTQ